MNNTIDRILDIIQVITSLVLVVTIIIDIKERRKNGNR